MTELDPGKQICVVGSAQMERRNPVFFVHQLLIIVFVVERESGRILDCDVNMVCGLTKRFVQAIFVGKNLLHDIEEIRSCVQQNYLGASAKSMIIATQAARSKLLDHLKKTNK